MKIYYGVESALSKWPRLSEEDGHVLVPTHCLYPSNSAVTVWVGPGAGAYVVHDNRGALDELSSAGTEDRHSLLYSTFMVQHIVKRFGLSIDESGLIKAARVEHDELLATIVLVANASKEAAIDLLNRFRPRLRRNIKAELASMLEIRFPNHVLRNGTVIGKSNKPHKFDNLVRLGGDRQLILDVVTREASSINAALVAHLDVKNAEYDKIEQRIIYDDDDKWSAADLNLLKLGATPVPFSRAAEVLERLAA
jgi:hypothetical protein